MHFNDSLQLINVDSLYTWSKPESGNTECYYQINDVMNGTAIMLSDGSCVVSARVFLDVVNTMNAQTIINDRSAILAKYANTFYQPDHTLIVEQLNDSIEYPAFFRSIDLHENSDLDNCLFQCVILNEHPQFGLHQPMPTGIVVTKTDCDLNVVWQRRYLTNANYQATSILATNDGGCLVIGSIGNYQTQKFDLFAMKVEEDGNTGFDEKPNAESFYIYPNPATYSFSIRWENSNKNIKSLEIIDPQGVTKVQKENVTRDNIDVFALPCGLYVVRVTDDCGNVYYGKLIINQRPPE